MIRLQGVSRIFEKTQSGLSPVDLEFKDGEWVTLLGPSGCGKTTLLRLIAGLETPGEGVLESQNKELGFVFQESALLPWMTVLENVALPLSLRGTSKKEAHARAREWLNKLRIGHQEGSKPHELSGGIKMRVSVARALVTEPRVLLLDEPFAALDEPIRIELGIELRELFSRLKPTLLMVTHSITEGLWLADRVLVLQGRPGRVVRDEPVRLGEHRTLSQRGDPEFTRMVEDCFQLLKGEGVP